MRQPLLIICTLLLFSSTSDAQGPTGVDRYGGLLSRKCLHGASDRFYVEKVGAHWWFCTPEGNTFFMHGVYGVSPGSTTAPPAVGRSQSAISLTKYGDSWNWGIQTMRRLKDMNFNAPIDYSTNYAFYATNNRMTEADALPFTYFTAPARYGLYGAGNYHLKINPLTQVHGFKEYFRTVYPQVHGNCTGCTPGQMGPAWSMPDIWDTMYGEYLEGSLKFGASGQAVTFSQANSARRKFLMGITIDDGDWMTGLCASHGDDADKFYPIVNGSPQPSKAQPHMILDLLNASPSISGSANSILPAGAEIMRSDTVKNGQVEKLTNAGTNLTVTFTKPHQYVVNDMISITGATAPAASLNGTYYIKAIPSPDTVLVESANVPDGNYTTSALSINDLRRQSELQYGDPRIDKIKCYLQTGVNPSDSSFVTEIVPSDTVCSKLALQRFLAAKYSSIEALAYAWGLPAGTWTSWGSSAIAHSNELLTTADGNTNTFNLQIPGITAAHQLTKHSIRLYAGSRVVAFDYCHQLSVGVVNRCTGTTGFMYGEHLISDPQSSQNTSPINYTTGQITVRFRYPVPAGTELRVDYTTGGWGTPEGRGFLDTYSLVPKNIWTLEGFTAQQKADLDTFLYWHARRYFLTNREVIARVENPGAPSSCAVPGNCIMYFGPTYLSGWGTPARGPILRAAQGLVDVLPLATFPLGYSLDDDQARIRYLFRYWGDRPMASWESIRANEQPSGYSVTAAATPYTTGTIAVTSNSTAVKLGSGAKCTAGMNAWRLTIGSDTQNESYRFICNNATLGTGLLDRPYAGATNGTAAFSLWKPLLNNAGDHSRRNVATQSDRGLQYRDLVKRYLNLSFPNGSRPMVGMRWWSYTDSIAESANWGLVNVWDDFYDDSIGPKASVDKWGYPTGGWPLGTYTNFIQHVKAANLYWHTWPSWGSAQF
jgi:hypothetical protein